MRHENHPFTTDLAPSIALDDRRRCFCEGGGAIEIRDGVTRSRLQAHGSAKPRSACQCGPTAHRSGIAVPNSIWSDTVLLAPQDSADIAFVADNPGDWMVHCHVTDHQTAGMMAVIRATA